MAICLIASLQRASGWVNIKKFSKKKHVISSRFTDLLCCFKHFSDLEKSEWAVAPCFSKWEKCLKIQSKSVSLRLHRSQVSTNKAPPWCDTQGDEATSWCLRRTPPDGSEGSLKQAGSPSVLPLLQQRNKIKEGGPNQDNRKRSQSGTFPEVDSAVIKWIRALRERGAVLSAAIVMAEATEFAKALGVEGTKTQGRRLRRGRWWRRGSANSENAQKCNR